LEKNGLASADRQERIYTLIQQLDTAYAKGLMSPKEYRTLRQQLEHRTMPVQRPPKKRRYFKLKVAMISVIAIMILASIPLLLRTGQTFQRPDFEVSNLKLDQDTLSITVKNSGTVEAHDVVILLRYSKDVQIRKIDILKPQEAISVTKGLEPGSRQQLSSTGSNIVISCKEGVVKTVPFKP